jgi:hypothetical protein
MFLDRFLLAGKRDNAILSIGWREFKEGGLNVSDFQHSSFGYRQKVVLEPLGVNYNPPGFVGSLGFWLPDDMCSHLFSGGVEILPGFAIAGKILSRGKSNRQCMYM